MTQQSTDTGTVQVKIRMAVSLRALLERLADQNGRSLSGEIVSRVAETVYIERALGGPEMRWLVNMVISAFTFAARMQAPEDPDWVRNRDAYRAGMFAVVDGLLAGLPDMTPEEIHLEIEVLKSRLLTRFVQTYAQASPPELAAVVEDYRHQQDEEFRVLRQDLQSSVSQRKTG
jgi:hypothetical protein